MIKKKTCKGTVRNAKGTEKIRKTITGSKAWTELDKQQLKREIESIIAAQNKCIKTNYVKAKIDKS